MKFIVAALVVLYVAHASANVLETRDKYKVEIDICEDCKNFVNDIITSLKKTDDQKKAVGLVCGGISNMGFKTICDEVLLHYLEQFIDGIITKMDPETICVKAKQCDKPPKYLERIQHLLYINK